MHEAKHGGEPKTDPPKITAHKKWLKPVLVAIGLVLAVTAGSLAWYGRLQLNRRYESISLPPAHTVKKDVVPDGFVRYTNEEFGFSFLYPETWGRFTAGEPRTYTVFTGCQDLDNRREVTATTTLATTKIEAALSIYPGLGYGFTGQEYDPTTRQWVQNHCPFEGDRAWSDDWLNDSLNHPFKDSPDYGAFYEFGYWDIGGGHRTAVFFDEANDRSIEFWVRKPAPEEHPPVNGVVHLTVPKGMEVQEQAALYDIRTVAESFTLLD
jgi:hypothetical protein